MTTCSIHAAPVILPPWRDDWLRRYDLGDVLKTAPMGGGMFAVPLLVTTTRGKYVVKSTRFRANSEAFAFQAATLDALADRGVRCPRVVRDRNGNHGISHERRFWSVCEYLPGRTLSWERWHECCTSTKGFIERVARHVALVHDALNALGTVVGNPRLDASLPVIQMRHIKRCYTDWRGRVNRMAADPRLAGLHTAEILLLRHADLEDHWRWAIDALDSSGLAHEPRQVVHGDVSPVNLVFDGDEPALIDWDCVHRGHRLYDACGDVLIRAPHDRPIGYRDAAPTIERYICAYRSASERSVPESQIAAVPVLLFLRQLEDLRQRVHVISRLEGSNDETYAALIQARLSTLREIRDSWEA